MSPVVALNLIVKCDCKTDRWTDRQQTHKWSMHINASNIKIPFLGVGPTISWPSVSASDSLELESVEILVASDSDLSKLHNNLLSPSCKMFICIQLDFMCQNSNV